MKTWRKAENDLETRISRKYRPLKLEALLASLRVRWDHSQQ